MATQTQLELLKERHQRFLEEGEDPNSRLMVHLRERIRLRERQEYLDKLSASKDPEERKRWEFLMQNPCQ